MRILKYIFSAAVLAASLQPAAAAGLFGGPAGKQIFDGRPHPAPFGHVELCVREAAVCRKTSARGVSTLPTGAVAADPERFEELAAVDRAVNRSIRPRPDRSRGGFADKWTIGARQGDCEEYALEKRDRLLRKGWPSSALVIAIGRIRGGVQHAVLLARVGDEVLVLDNLQSAPVKFNSARIGWLAVQSPSDPKRWLEL